MENNKNKKFNENNKIIQERIDSILKIVKQNNFKLLRYKNNNMSFKIIYKEKEIQCPICYDEKKSKDMINLYCNHKFCKLCLKNTEEANLERILKSNQFLNIIAEIRNTREEKIIKYGDKCPLCRGIYKWIFIPFKLTDN